MDIMREHRSHLAVPKDKLVEDLHLVISDAEALLSATATQAGETAASARARIQRSIDAAKGRLAEAETAVMDRAKEGAKATDRYVHDHPWQAIGVSACVGALIGMLIARR